MPIRAVREGWEQENPLPTMSMNLSSASWKTKGNIEPSSQLFKYMPGLKNCLQCTVVCIVEVSAVKRSATVFRHSKGVDEGKCSLLRRQLLL